MNKVKQSPEDAFIQENKDISLVVGEGPFMYNCGTSSSVRQLHDKLCKSGLDTTICIHLHDGCKGSAHLALGHGDLDLRKLLLLLRKIKYRHFLTIEVVGQTQIRDSWNMLMKHI